jgi:hypothetical protein
VLALFVAIFKNPTALLHSFGGSPIFPPLSAAARARPGNLGVHSGSRPFFVGRNFRSDIDGPGAAISLKIRPRQIAGDAARLLRPVWSCGASIAIPSEQRESRGRASADHQPQSMKIWPRQIATNQKTKSSVTYSKQRIGPLPNRYDFALCISLHFCPSRGFPGRKFSRARPTAGFAVRPNCCARIGKKS